MKTKPKKKFFTNHSKSSAAVVSIALHLILLLIAGTFVAVQVVVKSEKKFEAKQVSRPRMPPKKLQVPVKIKKQRRKPRLRQRIVVKTKVRNMPDIKMPEISGIKSGLGAVGDAGLGSADSIGFSMPEINIFGVRSKGEKVFIALDTDAQIMRDEVGGKRAYKVIKDELTKIIEGLGPTTLFNLAVFDRRKAVALFPKMVPASRGNVEKVRKWLEPLNAPKVGTTGTHGTKTLGKGGVTLKRSGVMTARNTIEGSGLGQWYTPAAEAMVEQADTVFILTGWWGYLYKVTGEAAEWKYRDRYNEYLKKSKEAQAKENKRRAAKGEPEQIFGDNHQLMIHYFPDKFAAYRPPVPPHYNYTGKDYAKAFPIVREDSAPDLPDKSGLTKKKRDKFSVNVIFFAPEKFSGTHAKFKELASRSGGDFRVIKGLKAIESSVSR
ncbi:MAG: hypothetical protein ABFR33_07195 [Verrucomicrobiota bacterium]